jgi:acyl carrier protein
MAVPTNADAGKDKKENVMNESLDEVVREVVARHLDIDVSEVDPLGHLRLDLHLDPLDLVLIALRLEDMEQREFPIHRLEFVETVSDIADVVEAMREGGFDEAIFTLDHPRASSVMPTRHGRTRSKRARRHARTSGALAHGGERVSSRSR